jgi:uncharacterized protein involved in type VI secretion and phage assembly
MHEVVETIRQIARHEAARRAGLTLGVVTSLHGANGEKAHACSVQLRDSGLVLPRVPIATSVIGMAALPRQGDLVVVGFSEGDPHGAVVLGRLYSEQVEPPVHGPGEVVAVLPGDETDPEKHLALRVRTPGDGSRALRLTLDGSVKVEVTVDDSGVRLETKDTSLELRQSGGSDGEATLKAGDASITLKQSGEVSIEATGKITLHANEIEISGDTAVKIAGTTIDLN